MSRDLFAKVPGADVSEYVLQETDRKQRQLLSVVAARHGLDVTAKAIGLSASHLRQALDGRDGRNFDSRHRRGILRFATERERGEYFDLELMPFGRSATPIAPRTCEQRLADLEHAVASRFGALGAELVELERSKP